MITSSGPIDVIAFEAANSRSYLRAVFEAWQAGHVVAALPRGLHTVPGLALQTPQTFQDEAGWFEDSLRNRPAGALSQIAFSSGTTGQPKALALTHGAQDDVVIRINTAMEVDDSIREYVGVPVTFSFGFGRVRAVATAGGKSFLPANGFDPSEIVQMLQRKDINAISAVPTLWRIVLGNTDAFAPGAKNLRWIEIGSQYMSAAEKSALRTLFPNAKIVQHYGLTEASRSALLDISEAPQNRLESVGKATGSNDVDVDDTGAIRVRGAHLASGLVTTDGIQPITAQDGWLTTSDRGRLEDGWLYYEGRTDELINCGGLKIDPARFEQRLSAALGGSGEVGVGRVTDPLRGERVLIATARGRGLDRDVVIQKAQEIAADLGLIGNGALIFRDVAEIPRTPTNKTRRAVLADLPNLAEAAFAEPQVEDDPNTSATEDRATQLQALWAEALGVSNVPQDKSFYDMGGDSLSALTTIMRMEAKGFAPATARLIFDGKTIAEIAGNIDPNAPYQQADTTTPPVGDNAVNDETSGMTLAEMIQCVHGVRGVLTLWVVAVHWLPGVLERLGDTTIGLYYALTPMWRFGTPGFAMVFGLGIGTLGLQHYAQSPAAAIRNTRFKVWLIFGGVFLLAGLRGAVMWTEGTLTSWGAPSGMFYSAIAYYALAMLAMPWILRLLSFGSNRLVTILMACLGAMILHQVLFASFAHLRPPAIIELIKILFTAKYGFFQMLGYTLIGTALGWVLRQHYARPDLQKLLLSYAGLMICLGGFMLYVIPPGDLRTSFDFPKPPHLLIYLGVLLLIIAAFIPLNMMRGKPVGFGLSTLNAFAIASGIMALPIFVGHEMVIPLKNLLSNLKVPESVALIISLGLFLTGTAIAYRRLLRFLAR